MIINIDGTDISYDMVGKGAPLLFLHGWGSEKGAFAPLIKALCEDFCCVALDFPGCGESPLPKGALFVEDYCRIVKTFIDKTGLENPIIIGHSNGGRVALHLCAKGIVSPQKIILFGAAGVKSRRTLRQKLRVLAFKTVRRLLTLPPVKKHTESLLQRARKYFGSADYNSAPPVMRQTLVNLLKSDITKHLLDIRAETLLIWGELDTASPMYMAKILEQKIPNCGLVVMKGCSHWNFAENPAFVLTVLRSFLSANSD